MAMFCLLKRRRSAKFQDQDNEGMAKHLYLAFSLILVQFVVSKAKQTSNGEGKLGRSYNLTVLRPFVHVC